MGQIKKTVFISYRETNFYHVLAIYQNLSQRGYDVYFDHSEFLATNSEQVIRHHIGSSAHFLILLTPSVIKRMVHPQDKVRRELDYAIKTKRHIIPLIFESIGWERAKTWFTDILDSLTKLDAVEFSPDDLNALIEELSEQHLDIALDMDLYARDEVANHARLEQQALSNVYAEVKEDLLRAEEYFEQGYMNWGLDHYEQAIEDCTKAITLSPNYSEAYIRRAAALIDLERPGTAIRDLNKAIQLTPKNADAFIMRGIAQAHRRRRKYDLAIQDYNKALRLDSASELSHYNRGHAYYNQHDYAQAIQDFSAAIRLKADYHSAYYMRAISYERQLNWEAAVADYKILCSLDRDDKFMRQKLLTAQKKLAP
jgi:tetratricopeptide (TPR) repeat protein